MPRETAPESPPEATDRIVQVCPRCGETFRCGARSSWCWCDEVTLTEEARAELRALQLDGCLCRACLEALEVLDVTRSRAGARPSSSARADERGG